MFSLLSISLDPKLELYLMVFLIFFLFILPSSPIQVSHHLLPLPQHLPFHLHLLSWLHVLRSFLSSLHSSFPLSHRLLSLHLLFYPIICLSRHLSLVLPSFPLFTLPSLPPHYLYLMSFFLSCLSPPLFLLFTLPSFPPRYLHLVFLSHTSFLPSLHSSFLNISFSPSFSLLSSSFPASQLTPNVFSPRRKSCSWEWWVPTTRSECARLSAFLADGWGPSVRWSTVSVLPCSCIVLRERRKLKACREVGVGHGKG